MTYLHRNGGHVVIVCGYHEGNYPINGRYYRYCLVIYDPNNSYTFYQFYITEDFSDFSFQDSNHTSSYEEYVQDTWKDMSYVGIDALQSSFYDSPFAYVWTLADSEATAEMTSADDNSRVQISISAYENFELMNAEGQTLCYDGEDYDGTMTVYSVKTVTGSASEGAETAGTLVLTVDASESFTLTGFEDGLTFASEISDSYYSASASGADQILLSSENGVVVEGVGEYVFDATISVSLDSCEMVTVSGSSSGTAQLNTDGDRVCFSAESGSENTVVTTCQNGEGSNEIMDTSVNEVTVSDSESGDTLIDTVSASAADTLLVRRGNRFYFSNTLGGQADFYIDFGRTTDEVLSGDWDGDGCDTLCVRRGNHYYINNTLESGNAAIDFTFGREDDEVLSGDWDGDGYDTLCIRRGIHYYINNTLEGGNAAIDFTFGRTGDSVLSGDWDGDGYDTLCIRRGIHYYINNTLEGGNAAIDFTFGREGDEVYSGTWTADDSDQTEYISVTLVKVETYGTGTVSFAGEDSSVTTKEFKAGDTVSITVIPDEGSSLSTTGIQYADGSYHWPDDFDSVSYDNGTVIEWTDSFTMPEESEDLYITYSFAIDPRLIVW